VKLISISFILTLTYYMLCFGKPSKNQVQVSNPMNGPAIMVPNLQFEGDQVQKTEAAPVREVYKTVGDVNVYLYIFSPSGHKTDDRLPAIVFFHGGSWKANPTAGPSNFKNQCEYLVTRGMVAIDAQYRGLPNFKITDCISDTQSAVRWVRANAKRLGIDPDRIAAGGGSAGGHLATCTATMAALSENGEDTTISCIPNALVLFNPAVSVASGRSLTGQKIRPGLPPTIIMHGKNDQAVPYPTVEKFSLAMKEAGNRCDLIGFEGAGHGFFNWNETNFADRRKFYVETLRDADQFLTSLGWIKGDPTIDH
jgi:acetyl esterase